jgi:hypothetical protein
MKVALNLGLKMIAAVFAIVRYPIHYDVLTAGEYKKKY